MDYYSFNRPRRDGWLSWPCWLTDSGRLTYKVVTRPAISLAQEGKFAGQDRRSHHYATPPTYNVLLFIINLYSPTWQHAVHIQYNKAISSWLIFTVIIIKFSGSFLKMLINYNVLIEKSKNVLRDASGTESSRRAKSNCPAAAHVKAQSSQLHTCYRLYISCRN